MREEKEAEEEEEEEEEEDVNIAGCPRMCTVPCLRPP
jgi:hypothetical protein